MLNIGIKANILYLFCLILSSYKGNSHDLSDYALQWQHVDARTFYEHNIIDIVIYLMMILDLQQLIDF